MELKQQLRNDIKTAMREGDNHRRDVIRLLMAAIKQEEVDNQTELDNAAVEKILQKQAKQRRESIHDYEQAGRPEQAAAEQAELDVIETYLPKMMSADEVRAAAQAVVYELGVTDMKGMGQVMGKLMPRLKGRADGRMVNQIVREILQS